MKKMFLSLIILCSAPAFAESTILTGITNSGEECQLVIHARSSNGMVVESPSFRSQLIEQAVYQKGDELITVKEELRKVKVNQATNTIEKFISILLDNQGNPVSYQAYDSNTLPVLGPVWPTLVTCNLQ